MAKAISSADSAPRLDPFPPAAVTPSDPRHRTLVVGVLRFGAAV